MSSGATGVAGKGRGGAGRGGGKGGRGASAENPLPTTPPAAAPAAQQIPAAARTPAAPMLTPGGTRRMGPDAPAEEALLRRFIVLPISAAPSENKKPELTSAAMTLQLLTPLLEHPTSSMLYQGKMAVGNSGGYGALGDGRGGGARGGRRGGKRGGGEED